MVLVVANVACSMLDTEDSVSKTKEWQDFFPTFEAVSVGIFTVEYLVRFYSIGAHKHYKGLKRFTWATSNFFAIVDILAIVPFYVDLCLGSGDEIFPTTFIRVLRLFRVFRLFKAGKFVEGMNVMAAVVMDKLEISVSSVCSVSSRRASSWRA